MDILINTLNVISFGIAVIGACVLVAAGALTIWACLFDRRRVIGAEDDEFSNLDIIERRINAISPMAPDHPGEIVPFVKRRVG